MSENIVANTTKLFSIEPYQCLIMVPYLRLRLQLRPSKINHLEGEKEKGSNNFKKASQSTKNMIKYADGRKRQTHTKFIGSHFTA